MSDNPMHGLSSFDRVSIRAVLVTDGRDARPALAEAGIVDPVAIPVVLGEHPDLPGGILGDGMTPNLIGVLETEWKQEFDHKSEPAAKLARASSARQQPDEPVVTMLPRAFGLRPLAPVVRKQST